MSRNQIRIEFATKTPFAGGVSFGKTGPYERLLGLVSFAIDPDERISHSSWTWISRRETLKAW